MKSNIKEPSEDSEYLARRGEPWSPLKEDQGSARGSLWRQGATECNNGDELE